MEKENSRDRIIVRTSVIGIITNVLLAVFKALIGLAANSIAILMDAVNNLSDAASSVITIIGTKLAGKAPDRRHPFGYGRMEYMSALVISVLVLYAGITSLTESVKKIAAPETPEYTGLSLTIVAVAVAVKIILGRYVKHTGESVNSDSLMNSGQDAMLDSVISASTLAAAAVYMTTGISLEAWLGAVISVVIIKSGIDMLRETVSELLGERADADLAGRIKETAVSFPGVSGAYDLVLNNYGPDSYSGSLHIEVPDTYSASDLDELIRSIQTKVYMEHHVVLNAIGVYSVNTKDPEIMQIRESVTELVMSVPHILQMHGFYVNPDKKSMRFDVIISFDAPDRRSTYSEVLQKVQERYPEYTLQAAMDTDFSES